MKPMNEVPKEQRPYEKCLSVGAQALNDSELLAVILRCGTYGASSVSLAQEILNLTNETPYPGLPGLLHLSLADLQRIKGIGKVKAIQLKCIGELSKRLASTCARRGMSMDNPKTIASYYMERLRHEEQEQVYGMFFDGRNHLLGERLLSMGTANSSLISPREIFVEALRLHAVYVVLIHNHPSGDPTPSHQDISFTRRVHETGEMIGISLLDHVIIGDHRYCSMFQEGLLENP